MDGIQHYKKRAHLSISSLNAFARCPRKFFYNTVGLQPPMPASALIFGEAIHAALPLAITSSVDEAMKAFTGIWDPSVSDEKRNVQRAQAMIEDFAFAHLDGKSIYNLIEPPSNCPRIADRVSPFEVPFAVDIGLPIPLVGRFDALAKHRDTGELYCVEWKTSSEISTRFFSCFEINSQILGYTMAAKALGLDVQGCIVEAIRVSKVNCETLSNLYQHQDHQIESFITWARWCGTQILACEKQGEFPKDISACNPYPQFGMPGYTCGFQNLCTAQNWTALMGMYEMNDRPPFVLVDETEKGVVVNG